MGDDLTRVRPRILLSRCLEFEACRYDGAVISDEFVRRLVPLVDFVTVCPEVGIGLGVPRQPVRLVSGRSGLILLQPSARRDLTTEMRAFSDRFLAGFENLDGAILKARSPSCGTSDVRIYTGPGDEAAVAGKGAGLFASAVLEKRPGLPLESEGRLRSFGIREHFLTRVFASAGFRAAGTECRARGGRGPLVEYHASMKLQLMTMNREEERRLGRLVASSLPLDELLARYGEGLERAMRKASRPGPVADALMHAMGFFSDELLPAEKAFFLESVESYRAGRQPLSVCLAVLGAWLARSPNQWLSGQAFFSPYPPELVDIADSGKGRSPG
jgi:uncharacterized protein YbgA (DUF1722 family)/uncharacterized protein YbbK (DUF523 family)